MKEIIMEKLRTFLRKFLQNFKRQMISLLLFVMPTKIVLIFLEVSLTVMLVRVRGVTRDTIDMNKFFKLVNSSYNESLIELPYYSIEYIWPKEFLDSERPFISGKKSIREILIDVSLLKSNAKRVVDSMLLNLPFLMRVRLGLGSETKRREIRNEMVKLLEKRMGSLIENNHNLQVGMKSI